MRLPRFLRTKNGIFRCYLCVLVAAYTAVFYVVFTAHSRQISESLKASLDCRNRCDDVLSRVVSIRADVEALVAECRGAGVLGGASTGSAPAPVSGVPEPEPEAEPVANPRVLGIGQNGRYAYADILYPDGQVYRQYSRLPAHLRK